jgi:ferredoxin
VLDGSFPLRAPYEELAPLGVVRPLAMRAEKTVPDKKIEAREGKVGYARERCVDCGACAAHCPAGALSIGNPEWKLRYADSLCTACGACAPSCMRDALRPVKS